MGRGERNLLLCAAFVAVGFVGYLLVEGAMAALQVVIPFIPDSQWGHRHYDHALMQYDERKCGSFFTTQVAQTALDPSAGESVGVGISEQGVFAPGSVPFQGPGVECQFKITLTYGYSSADSFFVDVGAACGTGAKQGWEVAPGDFASIGTRVRLSPSATLADVNYDDNDDVGKQILFDVGGQPRLVWAGYSDNDLSTPGANEDVTTRMVTAEMRLFARSTKCPS